MKREPKFHKPAYSDPAIFDEREGGSDPALISEAAHEAAHALVNTGREAADPEATDRFVRLAETEGIDAIAELWSHSPARSLAGALWRIYALREAVQASPERMSEYYQLGRSHSAPVAIAGVAEPPTSDGMTRLADRVLHGVYTGEVDVAFDRSAAFCRVIARGQALWTDARSVDTTEAQSLTSKANQLVKTAEELESAARAWRAGTLD